MASHFHRSSSFQFPRGPPSPPETNSDTIVPGMPVPILPSNLSLSGPEFSLLDPGLTTSSPEFPGSRPRKTSSIPYHPSGLRDYKDRSSSSHQRSAKALIIVVPPTTLFHERGQSQLSSNSPYHRLSQGIMMPLFPSMFGQLTAIAREFNFPSTSGIGLYLHYVEGGLTLTPRISDESWPALWSHFSDPSYTNERRALISGKIEFDIDHRLARWYGPWVSSIYREVSDGTPSYPHTAPYGHFRGESRTTTDGRLFDEDVGESSAIQQHSAPVIRHAPRKLSLVERFESPITRLDVKPVPLSLGTQPDVLPTSSVLSPIRQEDEPKSARQDLNSRVKSWRASAQLSPTPLAATGQISLEPPNLPNNMVLNAGLEVDAEEQPLRMEDFAWSVSSIGPQSEGIFSPIASIYVPSVHLDGRLAGSVCSTPSVRTSSGPSDYDPFSPELQQFARIPSPDIAHRFHEDGLNSPMTATTWGAPLSYPPSPVLASRAPSPDIGHRFFEFAPDTPMTATTWGAPLSYPPSPMCLSPAPSLDLGERSKFDDVEKVFTYESIPESSARASSSRLWSHVLPYTARELHQLQTGESPQSSATPNDDGDNYVWRHVWPYSSLFMATDTSAESGKSEELTRDDIVWRHVWPYDSHHTAMSTDRSSVPVNAEQTVEEDIVWRQVWPYNTLSITSGTNKILEEYSYPACQPSFIYPFVNIYPPVYPYFDIYPAIHRSIGVQDVRSMPEYPTFNIDTGAYPHNLHLIYPPSMHSTDADINDYPSHLSNLYPSVARCHANAYGHVFGDKQCEEGTSRQSDPQGYPHNLSTLYPVAVEDLDGYPYNLGRIYDTVKSTNNTSENSEGYPFFNIYPSTVPPFFSHLSLQLYGPQSQYPHFEIYPSFPTHASRQSTNITPKLDVSLTPTPTIFGSVYPILNLYPAVYPFFDLYPPTTVKVQTSIRDIPPLNEKQTNSVCHYPNFNLYPAVYPNFDLYPAIASLIDNPTPELEELTGTSEETFFTTVRYPFFNLYPGVYPFLEIYPILYGINSRQPVEAINEDEPRTLTPTLGPIYPSFNLYPQVYPYLDIYPAPFGSGTIVPVSRVSVDNEHLLHVSTGTAYPSFKLYPSVYPYFDLYPAPYFDEQWVKTEIAVTAEPKAVIVAPVYRYPVFNLYPAVYPYFDIYPSLPQSLVAPAIVTTSKPPSRLTHAELHAMVMMEKISSMGSFDYMEHRGILNAGEKQVTSHIKEEGVFRNLERGLTSARRNSPSSSSQATEVRRVSMAPRPGTYNAPPDMRKLPDSQLPHSLQHSHAAQGLPSWQLSRSRSLRVEQSDIPVPQRLSVFHGSEPTRSNSLREQIHPRSSTLGLPPRPSPRKRDSLVLQRIKAFDSTGDYDSSSFIDLSDDDGPTAEALTSTKDTLSKFPMPPKMTLPPLPIDRTG